MTKKRIYRCCISFLVICCVLFNFVTVPARAAATAIASGIVALLFSIGMGIVAVDLTMQAIGGYRSSLEKAGIELYQNDADKQSDFLSWIQNLGKDAEDGIIETTDTARDAIRHWGAGLMTGDGIEVEGETAPDGYAYYNGYLFPVIRTHSTYTDPYIFYSSYDDSYFLYLTNGTCREEDSGTFIISGSSFGYYKYVLSNNAWVLHNSDTKLSSINVTGHKNHYAETYDKMVYVWSSVDVGITGSEGISYYGSQPSLVGEVDVLFPSTFVGDIPGKIQSGEADEDQIYVPDRLNITQILTGEVDDLEAVNNVSSQLAAGTLTLEQYLEMTQAKDDTQAGTDVWVPPSDPGIYALDLTSYFPFCIPFDLFDFFSCLAADPVAPVIHWEVALPGGSSMPVDIDLSPFDSVAQLLRRLQLLLFAVGLAIKTRDLIRG